MKHSCSHRRAQHSSITLYLAVMNVAVVLGLGCSTPPSPTPPQASSIASKSSSESQAAGAAAPTTTPSPVAQVPAGQPNAADSFLGAKVGPMDLRKQVNDCNVAGNYFNRSTHSCDTAIKLAAFPCQEAKIRELAGIRTNEMAQFASIVETKINNPDPAQRFQFDQCVIPSTPDSDTGKTYRLKIYLAQETAANGNTVINTTVLRFEP